MNKTTNANISGYIFQIEDIAYDKLKNYLLAIQKRFIDIPNNAEIIEDIEARIAEILKENKPQVTHIITVKDIDVVIASMGEVEEMNSDDEDNEFVNEPSNNAPKRLLRDPKDAIVGGVCSGISAYFGLNDPIWLRLIFILLFFFGGGSILIYIVLWIVMPVAQTPSDRMQMRGEKVNLNNFEKNIREEFENIKRRTDKSWKSSGIDFFNRLMMFFVDLIKNIAAFLGKFLKVILGIVAILLIIILIIGGFAGLFSITSIDNFFNDIIFTSSINSMLTTISLSLIVLTPIVFILYLAASLFLKKNHKIKGSAILTFCSIWIVGIVMFALNVAWLVIDFRESYNHTTIQKFDIMSDTLFVENISTPINSRKLPYGSLHKKNNLTITTWGIISNDIELRDFSYRNGILKTKGVSFKVGDFSKSYPDRVHIKSSFSSQGGNNAEENANNIKYHFEVNNNKLLLNDFLELKEGAKWRAQQVDITCNLPEGMIIYFDPSMKDMLSGIQTFGSYSRSEIVGHYWEMTPQGLKCLDC